MDHDLQAAAADQLLGTSVRALRNSFPPISGLVYQRGPAESDRPRVGPADKCDADRQGTAVVSRRA